MVALLLGEPIEQVKRARLSVSDFTSIEFRSGLFCLSGA